MVFDESSDYWETSENEIFHSIPGTLETPSNISIDFVIHKLDQIDHYWDLCSNDLLEIAHEWESIDKSLSAQQLFKIVAISVNSTDNKKWEICFETKPENKWLYIGLHFDGERVVENDIST